jgi:hypothetical protein
MPSGINASLQRLQVALEGLSARGLAAADFEGFERELHGLFVVAEREVLAEELEALDMDLPQVMIGGQVHHRVLRSSETYTSAVGPVKVMRTLYRAGKGKAVVPLELRAGLIEGQWTPLAARQGSFLVAHMTAQESEAVLRELGNMTPSKSSLDRLPKRLGERWEAGREDFEGHLREGLSVPQAAATVAVSLDGVLVPMKEVPDTAKGAPGTEKAKGGYREAGCGTVSFYDAQGERLGSIRLGRMPQAKKATLKKMLSAEVQAVLAQRPELTVVKLADGAKDNWTYLSAALPGGVELIDFYHACEHLKAAFDTAYGQDSPQAAAQFKKYRHILLEDLKGAGRVIRALIYLHWKHPRRKRIGAVLGYFRGNRHRMGYAEARARNLPVGSGVVEAACKTLVSQRLKQSGMRWRNPGGQAILTLRSLVQSDRFDSGWKMLAETYHSEVEIPDNVVPFPRARAK